MEPMNLMGTLSTRKIKFLLVGFWNTFFGLTIFYFLSNTLTNYQYALILSFILATIQSHCTQRNIVWNSTNAYTHELFKFSLGISFFYIINAALLPICVELFELDVFLSQILITLTLTISSFYLQKGYVFKTT
jgi:putative flippase GtrA